MAVILKKGIILLLLIVLILFLGHYAGQYLTLEQAKEWQHGLANYTEQHLLASLLIYFTVYVIIAALSIPGAAIATLLAGALFGVVWGSIVVSFASTVGASLAFLVSRFLLRDTLQSRFAHKLETINQGIQKEGIFYLFSLRLIPIFPFFLVNLLMGLTHIKLRSYYWVSQLGMLPATVVYVNAGTQLASIQSVGDILSLPVILSFCLLGIFPLVTKKLLAKYQGIQSEKIENIK